MIEPFGGRLYQPVHDLATELDLPEALMAKLREKAQRRNNRKPRTPSKHLHSKVGTPASLKVSTSPPNRLSQ